MLNLQITENAYKSTLFNPKHRSTFIMGEIKLDFYIQDPLFEDGITLHEALLKASENAIDGGGAYAFVTAGGIKLLLEDKAFSNLLEVGHFKLIIGIDDVTSEKALNKVKDIKDIHQSRLETYVFLHNTKGSLFHPKFSWFKNGNGGTLVLGSGNLTEKGLRRNREAFSIINLSQQKIEEVEEYWNNWLSVNNQFLKSIDDEDVLKKANENSKKSSFISKHQTELRQEEKDREEAQEEIQEEQETEISPDAPRFEEEDLTAWTFDNSNSVLVAEIPDNNNRWKQANFSKHTFQSFFGATAGVNGYYRMLLRNVTATGELAETEIRPAVSVASRNYRIELGAATGLPYTQPSRPIGVFIRVSTRDFLYVLAMPSDTYYSEVKDYLDRVIPTRHNNQMKRHLSVVDDIKSECPNLPFWMITT